MKTKPPCCDYEVDEGQVGPVMWNPYNKVVQCHACGKVYNLTPREAYPQDGDKVAANNIGTFKSELQKILNIFSMENGSNTPDFILAEFIQRSLEGFNETVKAREKWYGREEENLEDLEDP